MDEERDPTEEMLAAVLISGVVTRATQSMDVTLDYLQQLVGAADSGQIHNIAIEHLRAAGRHQVRCYRSLMEAIDMHEAVPPEHQDLYQKVKKHALGSIELMMDMFRDPEERTDGRDYADPSS